MRVFVLFGLIIVLFAFAFVHSRVKLYRLSQLTWDELLAGLEPVPVAGICVIALDYLQPTKGQINIEPSELWKLIGGADGLRRMHSNAQILMALATYAQRWNPNEAIVVTERMRSDAVVLRRAMHRLSMGLVLRNSRMLGPFRVQEAASAYYLMRRRLLALYESSHAGRYPALVGVL